MQKTIDDIRNMRLQQDSYENKQTRDINTYSNISYLRP